MKDDNTSGTMPRAGLGYDGNEKLQDVALNEKDHDRYGGIPVVGAHEETAARKYAFHRNKM